MPLFGLTILISFFGICGFFCLINIVKIAYIYENIKYMDTFSSHTFEWTYSIYSIIIKMRYLTQMDSAHNVHADNLY